MKRPASAAPSSSGRAEPPTSSAERPGTALRSFFSPAASSAERPASGTSSAQQPATSLRNAEQPATPSQLKISSMRDVERWLAEEPIASCDSADMHDIIAAMLKMDICIRVRAHIIRSVISNVESKIRNLNYKTCEWKYHIQNSKSGSSNLDCEETKSEISAGRT